MARPDIQIDDEIREMTQEEYEALLATGWTDDEVEPAEELVDDLVEGEQP